MSSSEGESNKPRCSLNKNKAKQWNIKYQFPSQVSAKYVLMVFQFKQRQKQIENALCLPLFPVSYLGLLFWLAGEDRGN